MPPAMRKAHALASALGGPNSPPPPSRAGPLLLRSVRSREWEWQPAPRYRGIDVNGIMLYMQPHARPAQHSVRTARRADDFCSVSNEWAAAAWTRYRSSRSASSCCTAGPPVRLFRPACGVFVAAPAEGPSRGGSRARPPPLARCCCRRSSWSCTAAASGAHSPPAPPAAPRSRAAALHPAPAMCWACMRSRKGRIMSTW